MSWRRIVIVVACGVCAALSAGCGRPAAVDQVAELSTTNQPYVDWDDQDYHVDRFLQLRLKDFSISQGLGPRRPADAYRSAVSYAAVWDSVGLAFFRRLNQAEQADRRRLALHHHAEARRIVLAAVHHHRNASARGHLPALSRSDPAGRPAGVETAVTEALRHLVRATGMDPTLAAAWRDLGYFCAAAGDRHRQRRALSAALLALDLVDPDQGTAGDHARLRRDIFLDLAWLSRDEGRPEQALAYLDHARPWLVVASPERDERYFEAMLLRGLALAEQGEWRAAGQIARELPAIRVPVRAVRGGVREDLRWHISAPLRDSLGFERSAWPRRESTFGRQWIRAVIGAPSGDPWHTLYLMGAPPTDLELPARLASRYWQDRGRLHDLADDGEVAARCYQWAAYYRPYFAFFPIRVGAGPPRFDEFSAERRYYTGYGMFFLCGDRDLFLQDLAATHAAGRHGHLDRSW